MESSCLRRHLLMIVWIAGTSLLLSGCAGFTGLLPERYDGQAIEKNEEAIAAYNENQEIVGEGKELYLLEPFSEEILEPSLPLSEEPVRQMEPGMYTVGEDIPEGRYPFRYVNEMMTGPMSNATLTIRDAEGQLILEELLSPMKMTPVEVDLREGNTVTLAGEEFPVEMGVSDNSPPMNGMGQNFEADVTLAGGIWEIGEHLEAGTYVISHQPASGYLYIFDETTEPRIIEFRGMVELDESTGQTVPVGPELELTFEENQKIYLKDMTHSLPLMLKDGGGQ